MQEREEKPISVILPIYNMEQYLERMFQCLQEQTCQEFETILVNDGSKDRSLQMCQEFAKRQHDVTIVDRENGGLSAARNSGMSVAKGEYFAFIDPDDTIDADYLEVLWQNAKQNQADIMVCCTMIEKENETKKNSFWKKSGEACIQLDQMRAITQMFYNKYYRDADDSIDIAVAWAKLYRADFLKKHRFRFKEGYKDHEDGEFNIRAFQATKAIYYIDRPLYHYRYFNGNGLRKNASKEMMYRYIGHMKVFQGLVRRFQVSRKEPMYMAYQMRFLEFLFIIYKEVIFNPNGMEASQERLQCFRTLHKQKNVVQNLKQISYFDMAPYLDRKERVQLAMLKLHLKPLLYAFRMIKCKRKKHK